MKIKKQYEMKDEAWIHLGDGKLHKGNVIDFFDLEHAGYPKEREFYLIEIPTEIDPLLEVRTWEQISQDAKGPIGAYRDMKQHTPTKKHLGKVGIVVPPEVKHVATTTDIQSTDTLDVYDPTPDEINAAVERAERQKKDMYTIGAMPEKPKRFYKRKNEKGTRRPTL